MRNAIMAALLGLLPPIALADDVTQFPGLSRQALQLEISAPDGVSRTVEAMVIRPDGPGPYPLVLITHGTNRLAETFPQERPQLYTNPALVFAQRGYASVVVMRLGFGNSSPSFSEAMGSCENRDYLSPSRVAATEVLGALSVLQKQSWIDPTRVILLGHSTGGLADIAASASNPSGVQGVISFAGGNGSASRDYVCHPERLIEADRVFGQTAKIPSLWIYSANDHFFGPELATQMFDAYRAGGAPASLFQAPAYGNEGHSFIWAPDGAGWWPTVSTFLEALHMPTNVVVPVVFSTDLAPPKSLDDAGRTAFENYKKSRSYEKAFAVATNAPGHWGWVFSERTKVDAASAALKDCQKLDRVCEVYAIGNSLVTSGAPG